MEPAAALDQVYEQEHKKKAPIESVIRGRLDYIRMVRGPRDPVYLKLVALADEFAGGRHGAQGHAFGHRTDYQRTRVSTWRNEVARSIVEIHVSSSNGDKTVGTGWVVASGWIATAAHCLFEMDGPDLVPMQATVVFADGRSVVVRPEECFAHPDYLSKDVDAALVSVDNAAARLARPLPLAATEPAVGEDLAAMGYPPILSDPVLTVTTGTLQSTPRDMKQTLWLSIDADLHGGMSGGPVINRRGAVVGLVSGTRGAVGSSGDPTASSESRRALPSNYLLQLLESRGLG